MAIIAYILFFVPLLTGDPAKGGQISTAGAVGMLQINTTTYNKIGDHFVSFETVSKGTLYLKGVKFTVVP